MSQLAPKGNLASNTKDQENCKRNGGIWKHGWFSGHCEKKSQVSGSMGRGHTGKRKGKRSYKKHKTISKGKKNVRRSSHVKRNKK
jgi:hypothetical protein